MYGGGWEWIGHLQPFSSRQAGIWSSESPGPWTKVHQGTRACTLRCSVPRWGSYTFLLLQAWIGSGLGERLNLKVGWLADPALGELGKSRGKRTEIKGWQNLWDTLKGNFYIFVSITMASKWRKLTSLRSRREDDSGVLLSSHFPGVGGSYTLDASGGPCLLRPSAHTGEKLW